MLWNPGVRKRKREEREREKKKRERDNRSKMDSLVLSPTTGNQDLLPNCSFNLSQENNPLASFSFNQSIWNHLASTQWWFRQ